MLPMQDERTLKIELLSQWKLEAESRNSPSNYENQPNLFAKMSSCQ